MVGGKTENTAAAFVLWFEGVKEILVLQKRTQNSEAVNKISIKRCKICKRRNILLGNVGLHGHKSGVMRLMSLCLSKWMYLWKVTVLQFQMNYMSVSSCGGC